MVICLKPIFRRFFIKFEYFEFSSRFFRRVNNCTMVGTLSITFSDIYFAKMENDVITPSKLVLWHKFLDDI